MPARLPTRLRQPVRNERDVDERTDLEPVFVRVALSGSGLNKAAQTSVQIVCSDRVGKEDEEREQPRNEQSRSHALSVGGEWVGIALEVARLTEPDESPRRPTRPVALLGPRGAPESRAGPPRRAGGGHGPN